MIMESMKQAVMLTNLEEANRHAESACWWIKSIDAKAAEEFGVLAKVNDVLRLLQAVDDITMDITITIKRKIK